jgi:hypothetical protein
MASQKKKVEAVEKLLREPVNRVERKETNTALDMSPGLTD